MILLAKTRMKAKSKRSSNDANSSAQKATKKAWLTKANPKFAAKARVLYDNTNPSDYDTEQQCEKLKRKLPLAVVTASSQGIIP